MACRGNEEVREAAAEVMHGSRGRCARIQYMRLVVGAVHVGKGWEELAIDGYTIHLRKRFQSLGSDSNRLGAIPIACLRIHKITRYSDAHRYLHIYI